jgi:hypothetical protein
VWLLACLFEGAWSAGFLLLTLLTPSRPENAVRLGLSPPRLAMAALFFTAAVLSFLASARLYRRRRAGFEPPESLPPLGLWLALAACLVGATIVVVYATAAGAFPTLAISRLAPFGAWLLGSGVALSGVHFAGGEGRRAGGLAAFALMLAVGLSGIVVHTQLWPTSESGSSDVYYTFLEGQRLNRGENPYARVLEPDASPKPKFATYLPLTYYLAALVQWMGLTHFGPWIAAWRLVFLFANLTIALTIFHAFRRAGSPALGVLGALLWLFNRWTLHVSQSGDIDFLPLSLLVISAALLPERSPASLVLFGASVALKHVALAVAPIWLAFHWRPVPSARRAIADLLLMASVPALTSVPLLVRHPEAMLQSILFSWTRPPEASGRIESLDSLLGIPGLPVKILMVALLMTLCVAVSRRRLGFAAASMLAMGIVVSFNSVFFNSYMVWLIPFLPLAALETLYRNRDPAPPLG